MSQIPTSLIWYLLDSPKLGTNANQAFREIEIAIKKFKTGVPFRKAAEIAELDYWDFQAELDKRGIPVSSSLSLARARMKIRMK
jgi:predicted HTH domain antitoxin